MKLVRLWMWPVLVVTIVAVALRLVNLVSWPMFADESIYVRWSQVMRAEPSLRFLPLSDGKQPLFMWVTIPFFKLVSDPMFAGRLVSALSGVVLSLGVGVASYLLFKNRRQAIIAGLICACLPYTVFFSRFALADTMLAMFIIWAFNFSLLAFEKNRLDFAMISGFALGFAWLTKSPAIFAIGLLPLCLLLSKWDIKKIGYLLATYAIAFGMYNILRLGPEFQMIAIRNKDYVFSFSEVLARPLDPLIPHLRDSVQFYWYLATPVGLLLAAWGALSGRLEHWRTRLVLVAWWVLPIIAQSAIAKQFTARYLLFTVPFAIILMAHAVESLLKQTKGRFLFRGLIGVFVVSSLVVTYWMITAPEKVPLPRNERAGYLENWTAGQGIKEVSQYIRQAAQDKQVVVGSEGYFGTPFDGLKLYLNDVPNVRVIGVGIWVDSAHENLQNALADNQVFLVVNSTRFHANPEATPGLKLIAKYPKASPPTGPTEELLFFEVLPQ